MGLRGVNHEPLRVPGRERVAPISFDRCPVHDCLVHLDGEGRLLTLCDGCIAEAEAAILRMRVRAAIRSTQERELVAA